MMGGADLYEEARARGRALANATADSAMRDLEIALQNIDAIRLKLQPEPPRLVVIQGGRDD